METVTIRHERDCYSQGGVWECNCNLAPVLKAYDEMKADRDRLLAALYDTRKLHAYDDDHPCEACREELAADG